MPKNSSVQKKLQKIRPPRVQMTYDVEIGDAIENKELPLVVGVVGDFGGNSDVPQKRLKERSFVGIDRDNFDEVMKGIEPRAQFRVNNELTGEGGQFAVDLTFRSMDDFRPESVVNQVEPTCATSWPATTSSKTCSTTC
jgi:type VI secretion system protein ImpB